LHQHFDVLLQFSNVGFVLRLEFLEKLVALVAAFFFGVFCCSASFSPSNKKVRPDSGVLLV